MKKRRETTMRIQNQMKKRIRSKKRMFNPWEDMMVTEKD